MRVANMEAGPYRRIWFSRSILCLLLFIIILFLLCNYYYIGASIRIPIKWQVPLEIKFSESEKVFGNLVATNRGTFTDAKLTKKYIQNRENLRSGECVHLILETYNNKGMRQIQGGDFFFAVMNNGQKSGRKTVKENTGKWTAGKVTDHGNGTYSVYFYAGWSGPAYISIIMVHPREAVSWLKHVYRPIEGKNLFKGIFVNGSVQEESLCTIIREGSRKGKCVYQSPSALGKTTPVCDKPPNLPCNSLKFTNSITSYHFLNETLNETQAQVLFSSSNLVVDTGQHIEIHIKDGKLQASNVIKSLPKCEKGLVEPPSEGFWVGDTWNSLACDARISRSLNNNQVLSCLKNRKIFLLGDSTTRQWYENLIGIVGINSSIPQLKGNKLAACYNEIFNITLTFQFHPWTFARHPSDLTQMRHASDVINALTDPSGNYVIVVSPWAHFTGWTLESYEEMLVLIRIAIEKHKERCPDSIVVIKGTHARDHKGEEGNIGGSDWILYDMNRLLRKTFAEVDAIFIDVWDMNLCYPSPNKIHMPKQVVIEEIMLFLSYICPK